MEPSRTRPRSAPDQVLSLGGGTVTTTGTTEVGASPSLQGICGEPGSGAAVWGELGACACPCEGLADGGLFGAGRLEPWLPTLEPFPAADCFALEAFGPLALLELPFVFIAILLEGPGLANFRRWRIAVTVEALESPVPGS